MSMSIKKSLVSTAICTMLMGGWSSLVQAQAVEAKGVAEVTVGMFGDAAAARLSARKSAEKDAIKAALRLKQNIDVNTPAVEQAVPEIVKALGDNLRTTFAQEGSVVIAKTTLRVDGAELTDIVRSMNLQNKNAMAAASIVFYIDEYWGVGTKSDPAKPVSTEMEYFHDKSARSDTSSKSARSAYSDTSAKESSASSYDGRLAASSRESASMSASQRSSASGSSSASYSGSDRAAIAAQDSSGAVAGSRSTAVAASRSGSFSGSSSESVAAARSSDDRVQVSVKSSSASSSDVKNVKASSYAGEQKNIQQQNDVVSIRTKTVYPEMGNAKPVSSSLVAAKLAETIGQYGLKFTSEQDLRETGKGRMLISDIATQGKYRMYIDKAAAPPYSARYVVFGAAQMRTDGPAPDGQNVLCSGELTYEAISVAGGNNLPSATVVKTATARGDELCRARLADAMAAEVGAKAGNAAAREMQMAASQGSSYTVTLYSQQALSRRVARPFEDALSKLFGAENVADGGQTDSTRVYQVTAKGGDLKRRLEDILDGLGDTMAQAEVRSTGARFIVCTEGKCPASY
jgi:hypothetical protein